MIDTHADDPGWVRKQTTQAIDSLRNAIGELRAARGTDASALALGFAAAMASTTPDGPVEPVAHSPAPPDRSDRGLVDARVSE